MKDRNIVYIGKGFNAMLKNITCSDCGCPLELEGQKCPKCGGEFYTVSLNLIDNIAIDERIEGKTKVPGQKKPAREFIYGVDYSKTEKQYMEKERIIDRENDNYHEKITDPNTGKVIHECNEPLTKHFGHGSAKFNVNEGKKMGNFKFTETKIKDVFIIEPKVYGDNRGYFMETYKETDFVEAGLDYKFVQDNQSSSRKGVLRGLHFQKTHPQAKLVRVLSGEVFDVAVDLRKGSETYGQWIGVLLSGENKKQFMIPRGFAHGFVVVSDYAEFAYKCDEFYHPEDEGGLLWNDLDIAVEWPDVGEIILSEKDKKNPTLAECKMEF